MGNASFDETALRITPSPPPSHGSNSASSDVEAKYLSRVRTLHYARLALSVIFIALGLAVVGSEAHALRTYQSTNLGSEWWLPLWPQRFDLRPTISLLIGGVIITVASLLYTIVALIPSPHSRTTTQNILYTTTTFASLLTALLVVAYTAHIQNQNARPDVARETLQSWTCRWASGVSAADAASASDSAQSPTPSSSSFGTVPSATSLFGLTDDSAIEPPAGFQRICQETKAAWGIAIAMVCAQGVLGLGFVAWGWWLAFRVWRERKSESKKWTRPEFLMQTSGHGVAAEVH